MDELDLLFSNQEFLDRVEFSSDTLNILDKIEDLAERDRIDFLFDIDYDDY